MLPFYVFSLTCALIAFGFCVWFLVKDRNFWRSEYRTRDTDARLREQQLFDQLLRVKGFKATTEPVTPPPTSVMRPVGLDPEDLEIIDSRINERVSMGVATASEGFMWANQLRDGSLTPAELDRIFWKRSQQQYPGSVADID